MTIVGKHAWQPAGGAKRIASSGTLVYLRALQGHSGIKISNPTLQDNVIM